MDFLLAWSISAIGVIAAAKILPGAQMPSLWDAAVIGTMFGVLNFFFGWLIFVAIGVVTIGVVISPGVHHASHRERICIKTHRRCIESHSDCQARQPRTCGADYQWCRRSGGYVDTSMHKRRSERPALTV